MEFNLKAVYCIGILDFTFDDYESAQEKDEVVHTIKLKNQHGKVFYDKLTYIYLEMPNFQKQETALTSRLDKWLYFIKNLEDFQTIPSMFKDEIFSQAFEKAELAKLDQTELDRYENSLKVYRDLKGVIDTAFDDGETSGEKKGKIAGKIEGKIEVAKALKAAGVSIEIISLTTGISSAEIEKF